VIGRYDAHRMTPRLVLAAGTALTAVVLATAAPSASASAGNGGWDPAPFPPTFDRAAGVVCDFAVHGENLVDEVRRHVILTFPDGGVRREALQGALVIRLTNTSNGTFYDADAGGSAIVEHHPDGSLTERIVGPALARIPAGRSNLPRGLYVLDGVYVVDISATGFITFTFVTGGATDLCPRLAGA
jgi:hypothetical protein